jgi:N5-(cytidine 5'-diphosphoramidyl)-L-glutamine hydrolase
MKKIAISQRIDFVESHKEMRDALDISWSKWLTEMDFLPVPIPSLADTIHFLNTIQPDGVILTGGNDLSIFNSSEASILRDKVEKHTLEYALNHQIPVVGVCRGAQFIAHYFGCKLDPVKGHVNSGHEKVRHPINIETECPLTPYLNEIKLVNSYHSYAVTSLSPECIAYAKAEDNTIEAFGHINKRIFAQLWHPERETPFQKWNQNLIMDSLNIN